MAATKNTGEPIVERNKIESATFLYKTTLSEANVKANITGSTK